MKREQVRHGELSPLEQPRELLLVCPQFKSNVNLSRIVRLASCCGVQKMIVAGQGKIDPKIARDGAHEVTIERRRSIAPILKKLKADGYRVVGLEQTDDSKCLHDYPFVRKCALIIGHERLGITTECLACLDEAIEIPVFGLPYSYNVVTATTMAMYEYCKQFPKG